MREPPCGGFPWGTRQNWTLTFISNVNKTDGMDLKKTIHYIPPTFNKFTKFVAN